MDEHSSSSLTARLAAAAHACLHDLRADGAVDLAHSQHRCDVPNVIESDAGKLATPFGGNTNSIKQCHDLVAEPQPAIKTCI